ncbi:MAG: hypothetical protein ACOC1K_06785 [Nanoarchaeota archaeon]
MNLNETLFVFNIMMVVLQSIIFMKAFMYTSVLVRNIAIFIVYANKEKEITFEAGNILKPGIYWGIFYLLNSLVPLIKNYIVVSF